jgi:hypothetical protein
MGVTLDKRFRNIDDRRAGCKNKEQWHMLKYVYKEKCERMVGEYERGINEFRRVVISRGTNRIFFSLWLYSQFRPWPPP